MHNYKYISLFKNVSLDDVNKVGSKNASLGELYNKLAPKGINIPDGFVITTDAYWAFLDSDNIRNKLNQILNKLDRKEFSNLNIIGNACRTLIMNVPLPESLSDEIIAASKHLNSKYRSDIQLAVRSSAAFKNLPYASFAGQQESYLNIESEEELLHACIACYASLFTNRAIKYREENNFNHLEVGLSIGVQKMVRSDKACAGIAFTFDPETGFNDVVTIRGSWGLGENVVKGNITADEFILYKPALKSNKKAILSKYLGAKQKTMTYVIPTKESALSLETKTINLNTDKEKQEQYVLTHTEIEKLGNWSAQIEEHYQSAMDIEWAKDGVDDEIYIVQARPTTRYIEEPKVTHFSDYKLLKEGNILIEGIKVGNKIISGKARILKSPAEIDLLQAGEILVTHHTNPDWDPVLRKALAIITDRGGITSHAAIIANETGSVAVVSTGNATNVIEDGQEITVSAASAKKGVVYEGLLEWNAKEIVLSDVKLPRTKVMLMLSDPSQAFKLSFLPNKGVGLLRLEFIFANSIKIHPMALVNFKSIKNLEVKQQIEELTTQFENKEAYFIEKLSQSVATIAAAFYPKEVLVRMSDFKTNEYANMIGGKQFEPKEENPMLGWRGASRYYSEGYKEAFRLECEAMKLVRDEMGFTNVKLMIPFCRTPKEAGKVLKIMEEYGLKQGENALEIYLMAEVPSNVILAEEFAQLFDGFSIGSNDLTQLSLGVERDSVVLSDLFDAENEAIKRSIKDLINKAHDSSILVGLCGQAAGDSSEFADLLIRLGIDSITFSPDNIIKGIETINRVESYLKQGVKS
ncbi:phosphoenolpyruvate synthase [Marivirga sp. S37H4]|uniref:Phosphoenolpyruvate synthase n=1 Tax=Marivirga aurantiaca TaxID=2802615 RepID=A0A935C7N3_9BACT|nr:phosphoenolpyruvate synthase [Marivirga aurantiaca]MBK6264462.1 phosphoenolpyruvate synthase [Marivirga aurantiaca]